MKDSRLWYIAAAFAFIAAAFGLFSDSGQSTLLVAGLGVALAIIGYTISKRF
jgi:hypothetical protein